MCFVNYQVLVRGWLGSVSPRATETYGIWWEENFIKEPEVSKNTMIANSSQDAKFKKQLDGGTNCAGKSNSVCTVLSQQLQIGRWVEFSPVEKEKARRLLPLYNPASLRGAHRGLVNEVFKRVAIILQPRRAGSFCSTNWSTGAVLTLAWAWLAWELQPAASQTSALMGRLCCKPHLLPAKQPWKHPLRASGGFISPSPSPGDSYRAGRWDRLSPHAFTQAERNVFWLQALTLSL